MIKKILARFQRWSRQPEFQEGAMLSRFIARDVRRDILVVSTERLAEGIITGQVRTTNLLYLARGLISQPEFEPPVELDIERMWQWTGADWGGLPDGTSIVDRDR